MTNSNLNHNPILIDPSDKEKLATSTLDIILRNRAEKMSQLSAEDIDTVSSNLFHILKMPADHFYKKKRTAGFEIFCAGSLLSGFIMYMVFEVNTKEDAEYKTRILNFPGVTASHLTAYLYKSMVNYYIDDLRKQYGRSKKTEKENESSEKESREKESSEEELDKEAELQLTDLFSTELDIDTANTDKNDHSNHLSRTFHKFEDNQNVEVSESKLDLSNSNLAILKENKNFLMNYIKQLDGRVIYLPIKNKKNGDPVKTKITLKKVHAKLLEAYLTETTTREIGRTSFVDIAKEMDENVKNVQRWWGQVALFFLHDTSDLAVKIREGRIINPADRLKAIDFLENDENQNFSK